MNAVKQVNEENTDSCLKDSPDNYVYFYKGNMYINLTSRCLFSCVFCDKERLSKSIGTELALKKEPSANQVIDAVPLMGHEMREFIFCGTGEPLLKLDILLEVMKALKRKYTKPIRLNTTGPAKYLYKERDVAKELKEAGLDMICVSLNATNEKEYMEKHKAPDKEMFMQAIKFAQECKKQGIDTKLSFVNKDLDKHAAMRLQRKHGVLVMFRDCIE